MTFHGRLVASLAALLAAWCCSAPAPARAQLSPGDLSRAHAMLDGSSGCRRCHDAHGVSAAACLACHTLLAQRIRAGAGLHRGSRYARCETCHVEHQGRSFSLIDWGAGGEAAFDHRLTGYPLAGAHARLSCRRCHVPREPQSAAGVSRNSYLGLATECNACHRDPHRGQLAPAGCTSCHGQEAWKPASGFAHERTAFPLAGKHASTPCASCHRTEAAADGPVVRYRGVAHTACTDCHRDPHGGRLGATCSSCHDTTSWQPRATSSFDHDRTRYPLAGLHRNVACAACHGSGAAFRRPAFAHCTDCHRDAHGGQLARRSDRGACESCHSVTGWTPSSYGVETHRTSRYPLTGAHLAVPCSACHTREKAANGAAGTLRFTWTETRCTSCHRDPHGGDLRAELAAAGCESCHETSAWSKVRFDHQASSFPLRGKHASLGCADCHRPTTAGAARPSPLQLRRPTECAACHADPHAGQLQPTACTHCHGEDDWHRLRFDHARDSRYRLDGAHAALACAACHHAETVGGRSMVRYKPLPVDCAGCHGASATPSPRP